VQTNSSIYIIASLLSGLVALLVSTILEILFTIDEFSGCSPSNYFGVNLTRIPNCVMRATVLAVRTSPCRMISIQLLLNFFEELGYFHAKNMVHRTLVSCSFADDILDVYEHPSALSYIDKTRAQSRNQHYYVWFLCLAEWCQLQENLEKASSMKEWLRIRFVELPSMTMRRQWELHRLWLGPTRKRTALTPVAPHTPVD